MSRYYSGICLMGKPLKKIIRAENDKARIRTWHFSKINPGSYPCTELFIPMKLFVLEKFSVINYVAQNCIVIQE
jgi:hypothetical protein